jgi:hypothetical protein
MECRHQVGRHQDRLARRIRIRSCDRKIQREAKIQLEGISALPAPVTTRGDTMNVIQPPHPVLDKRGEPHVRRYEEQRWLIDNVIRANGIDWDQPRSLYLNGPCGNEANADFAGIRERVKKMGDIGPAFEAVARRREAKAQAAEQAGHKVTARDNYFMAAVHWGAAQWPYDQNNETNIAYNNKKRECYAGVGAVQGQGDPGLVPSAARL